jgi:CheY-like chemotaxis protein
VTELTARDLTLDLLFARLRSDESTRCIPVLVLTRSSNPADFERATDLGATVVLPKLADFNVLRSWIDALC